MRCQEPKTGYCDLQIGDLELRRAGPGRGKPVLQGCAAATSLLPPRVASARVLHLPISAAFGVSSPRVRRMGLAQLGGSPCTVVSVSCLRCKRSGYTSGLPAPRDWILVVHSHDDARNGNGGHIPSFFFFLCAFANYNAKVIHQEVGSFILMCNGGRAEVHVSARSCSRARGKEPTRRHQEQKWPNWLG